LRENFPILDQKVHGHSLIYFDNAATSQKPRAVIDAPVRYYECDNANGHRGPHELSNHATDAFEASRVRAAKFLNARSAEEIIFTRGITESINLVAAAWGTKLIKRGDKILLTEMEYQSNIVPWQLLAKRTGAQLVSLPTTGRAGHVSFRLDGVHAHNVVMVANQRGVALRGGHHCNQPHMKKLGVESTARTSFHFYNTTEEIDHFVEHVRDVQKYFGT
jgi:selenocysteine lyase/cysteine desulfurase